MISVQKNLRSRNLAAILVCLIALSTLQCTLFTSVKLPVDAGHKLPKLSKKIILENAKEIVQVAHWTLPTDPGEIVSMAFSPDGNILALGYMDGVLRLFDYQTGNLILQIDETGHLHLRKIHFVSNANQILLGYFDGTLCMIGLDGKIIWQKTVGEAIYDIALSADGAMAGIVTVEEGKAFINFIQTADGKERDRISGASVAFLPDRKQLIVGSVDGELALWSINPLEQKIVLDNSGESAFRIVLSPDGKTVLTVGANARSSGDVRMFKTNDGSYVTALWATKEITSTAFSPESQVIATGTMQDKAIQLWGAENGEISSRLLGHTRAVSALLFHPSGYALVSGSLDGSIFIWGIP